MKRPPLRPADPLRWFDSTHVQNPTLKLWMQHFQRTAQHMLDVLVDTPSTELALQLLMQCKDATTRAVIETAEMYATDQGQLHAPPPPALSGLLPPSPEPLPNQDAWRAAHIALLSLEKALPGLSWKVVLSNFAPHDAVLRGAICTTIADAALIITLGAYGIRFECGKGKETEARFIPMSPFPPQRPDTAGEWVLTALQEALAAEPAGEGRLGPARIAILREILEP